jgi:type IV pilus assembly protein PilO
MNLRDPKNQLRVIVVIVFLAAIYLWATKIYTPYSHRLEQLQVEHENLGRKLNSVRQKAETLEGLQEEYAQLQAKYKTVQLLLPEKKEDESYLNQIHAAAQLTNSVVTKITPLGTVPAEFYDTNNYTVEVEASYHGLGEFFAKVANFPFIVNLSDLQMKSSMLAGGGSGARLAKPTEAEEERAVSATVKMSTYNVKQGM